MLAFSRSWSVVPKLYMPQPLLTLSQKLTKVIPDTPKGETPIHLRSTAFK